MSIAPHHKELAKHLRSLTDSATVSAYRDDNGMRAIDVGTFETQGKFLYSTFGVCDKTLSIPSGCFEFAAFGTLPWLPNAIVSSVYWLEGRSFESWPLVCEDVVRPNAQSTYRHMAYSPSTMSHVLSSGQTIQWLLGLPITDNEISITHDQLLSCIGDTYPKWLL